MPVIRIEDAPGDSRLRPYAGMTDGQLRRGEGFRRDNPNGLFIGESKNVIERALASGLRPQSLLVEDSWANHEQALVQRVLDDFPEVPVFAVTTGQFTALTGYQVVRGALACFERPPLPSLDDVLQGAHRVAVLENVTNYANMGAIFRSAAALGLDAVLVSPSCHDPYYRRCARVSMGAVFQVPWTRIGAEGPAEDGDIGKPWARDGIARLHERGFACAALALREDALDLRDSRLHQADKLALVLGTEGEGLADETIDACDWTVCIPMAHGVDSLNVAAAAAIAFWELVSA